MIEVQLDGLRGAPMSKVVERLMATPPGAKVADAAASAGCLAAD